MAVTGAADIPVELIRRVHAELPFDTIVTGYGLTEGGTACATEKGDDPEAIATTVGRARPSFEMRVVGEGDRELGTGEAGEVLLRGGSVMAGYLDDPEETAKVLSADGWLRTGDLGVIDDAGRLRIVGRVKDMFIVGGFNAYPAEIENALLRHPAIRQAAVIGVPDQRLGEVGHGVRRRVRGRVRSRHHRLEPRADGQLQGAARRRDRGRPPAERHRQGREGRAASAGSAPQAQQKGASA